ncbi:ABC transporter substrate-binding protein [Microlunatus soli]|uniref:Carbohydrate ABC transporter substrate-binding protein, CUT1 family n=1 Tax=Microlunatus soli TaxID=630515 RepID=A0A1H1YJV8_9ACTN|nr:extracellular solute-binding protein [Microlunatus soli]SDT21818.1 carbohydrate ABC transporter substrate-binding protein, CUT1 family [Microlunatus soli]
MVEPTTISRRRMLGGALATAAGAAGLSGCNLAKGGGGGSGTTLNVWGGVPNETGPDDLCAAFMSEHPDIKVTYTRYVNDDDGNIKLDTALSGGVPIDIYFSYAPQRVAQRAHNGLALDLTDKINAEKDLAPFTADASPQGNFVFDGKLHCLPAALAPVTVYVNKSMLDDAGIKLGDNWTVDGFVDVATELTRKGRFGTLNSPSLARPALGPDYRYTDGGKASNFADPWFSKELELALKLQKSKIAMDQQTIIAEKLDVFSQAPFIAGRVAMLISSGQIIRSINDTKGYPHDFVTVGMPIPSPEKGKQGWNTGSIGDLMAISPKSKHQDEAWELTKFWMRNAGKYMVKGGRLPSMPGSTSEDDVLKQLLTDKADTLYDVPSWKNALLGPAVKYPVDTIFTAGTEIDLLIKDLNDETLLGDRTVKSWVSQAVKQSDAAIKKAGA